jgi:hypothetical protein
MFKDCHGTILYILQSREYISVSTVFASSGKAYSDKSWPYTVGDENIVAAKSIVASICMSRTINGLPSLYTLCCTN